MNTDIAVLRELDELVEAARLLGVTQAKRGFGCHTDEDSRFERAMYESIDKHRAALLAALEAARADAERYRWLKKSAFCNVWARGDGIALVVPRTPVASVDSKIDAEMAKEDSNG